MRIYATIVFPEFFKFLHNFNFFLFYRVTSLRGARPFRVPFFRLKCQDEETELVVSRYLTIPKIKHSIENEKLQQEIDEGFKSSEYLDLVSISTILLTRPIPTGLFSPSLQMVCSDEVSQVYQRVSDLVNEFCRAN